MFRSLLFAALSLAATPALADPFLNVTRTPSSGTVPAPGSVTVNITASSPEDYDITSVKLFQNNVEVGNSTNGLLSVTRSNLVAGTYSFRAEARDHHNQLSTETFSFTVTPSAPPTVTLTPPTGTFNAPATLAFSATATDADGTVTKVEFTASGGVVLGTDTTAPYQATWTNAPAGTHTVAATATDNSGATKSAFATVVVNAKPTVSLTAPIANQLSQAGAAIVLSANATDDVGVTRVEFFVDSQEVGEDASYPYSLNWTGAAGSHTVYARAYDANGLYANSTAVPIVVNALPVLTLTSPTNGATATAPASIALTATATDADGIASVKFVVDGTVVNTDTTSPYAFTWNGGSPGVREIQAIATDTRGGASMQNAYVTIASPSSSGTVLLSRKYTYNAQQELCRVVEPETGATLMGYDNTGNLVWSASGLPAATECDAEGDTAAILARRSVRTYDARKRVLSLAFPDRRGDTTYAYTKTGQVVSMATSNEVDGGNLVTTNYAYKRRGLLDAESMTHGAVVWPIDYAYDRNANLASQVWHGLTVDYAPNALGQATKAGTFASGAMYYPNGALKQFTYGNGITHAMTQNLRGLPEISCDSYGACGSSAYLNDAYDYDANGNVLAISDGVGTTGRGDRDMTYDGLDRLKTAASPMFNGTVATYTYDVLDNLKTVQAPGRSWTYYYDGNWQLTNVLKTATGISEMGFGYDPQGNLNNRSGREYVFDFGNRLRSVEATATAPAVSYLYDGLGLRIRDYNSGGPAGSVAGSKYSQYSKAGQLMQTSDTRSGKFSEYIYLAGSLVAIRERTGPAGAYVYTNKYQHTDALGSPVVVTDANRSIVGERSEYEPFGQVLKPLPIQDGPGYTGHVLDAATGLNYMQQRYYDPSIGRFLSVDPVSADTVTGWNFNRYNYAANNPYRFKDPDGREINAIHANQQTRIENDINSQATEEFRFDSNNKLQSVGPSSNPGGSQTYTDSLKDGIGANTAIKVGYQQTYTDANGAAVNIDTAHGGGLTGQTGSGNIVVLITGNSLQTTDAAGNAITDTSADIMRHEVVGHAVPQALARDATGSITGATGNAISNDNVTRGELGKTPLAPDPSHTEYQP